MIFPFTTVLSLDDPAADDHLPSAGYAGRIGYDSRGTDTDASITSDSEEDGGEGLLLLNWKAYDAWVPATAGTHHVDVALPVPRSADYFAFGRYAIIDPDATIVLRSSADGITYTDCFPAIRMGDWGGRPKWVSFTSTSAAYWRIQVASPGGVWSIAVAAFGVAYWPRYVDLAGWEPFLTALDIDYYDSISDDGTFLGRSKLNVTTKNSITARHMTYLEWQTEWAPFMFHATNDAFFIAPNLARWPDEVALVQSDGAIPKPAVDRPHRFTCTMPMRGMVP